MTPPSATYYRPICGCDVCRRRRGDTERRAKRRYYPCEARIIVAEMTRAGATKPQIADVLGSTPSAVRYLRRALRAEGRAVDRPRHVYRIEAHAQTIADMFRAGASYSRISRAVGFDVRKHVFRARRSTNRSRAEQLLADASAPYASRGERMRKWWADRRAGIGSC